MELSLEKRFAGSSLLECVAATVIVGTAIVAGLALFESNARLALASSDVASAVELLSREVERAQGVPFEHLQTHDWSADADVATLEKRWEVVRTTTDIARVRVSVRYPRNDGSTHAVFVDFFAFRGGDE